MIMISEDEIRERLGRLAETVTKFPLLCYPTVRQMFPRKIRMMPKGKAYGGRNLYSMVGRILLNSSLATDFDRFVDNKKGEVGKPASPAFRSSFSTCEPKKRGFTQFEFGVTNPLTVIPPTCGQLSPIVGVVPASIKLENADESLVFTNIREMSGNVHLHLL